MLAWTGSKEGGRSTGRGSSFFRNASGSLSLSWGLLIWPASWVTGVHGGSSMGRTVVSSSPTTRDIELSANDSESRCTRLSGPPSQICVYRGSCFPTGSSRSSETSRKSGRTTSGPRCPPFLFITLRSYHSHPSSTDTTSSRCSGGSPTGSARPAFPLSR